MAQKVSKRKITYHVLQIIDLKTGLINNNFNFTNFKTWFDNLNQPIKLHNFSNTKFTSLDLLETTSISNNSKYSNAFFGMMSTGNQGSRRNLKDSKNNNKRQNPKRIQEGEEQENYFLLLFRTPGDIEIIFQNSAHSIKINQFKDYIEKYISIYCNNNKLVKDFTLKEGTIIDTEQAMLSKLDRITKTKLYIDKSILDNELGLSDRTLQVKDDLVLEVTAQRDRSIKEFLTDIRQKAIYKTKVDRLWVEGKDSKGNISSFFINDIQKRKFMDFEVSPDTAELISSDVKEKLLSLVDGN